MRDDLSKENLETLNKTLSARAIAEKLDVAITTVYRSFKLHGITPNPGDDAFHKQWLAETLTSDYLQDAIHSQERTVAQVAMDNGCSMQTIYSYLRRYQIDKPKRKSRTRPAESLKRSEVDRLYRIEGLSIRQVAKQLNVGAKTIRAFMVEHQIQSRDESQNVDETLIVERYLAGETMGQIASDLGCSVWTISQRLETAGVARRIGKRPPSDRATRTAG